MIDYDELIALCLEDDPIISDDDTTSYDVVDGSLLILSSSEDMFDIKIKITEAGFRIWVKDSLDNEIPFVGDDWTWETDFENFEDLRSWVYSI